MFVAEFYDFLLSQISGAIWIITAMAWSTVDAFIYGVICFTIKFSIVLLGTCAAGPWAIAVARNMAKFFALMALFWGRYIGFNSIGFKAAKNSGGEFQGC